MKYSFYSFLILLWTSILWAGPKVIGNGGDAVVCASGNKTVSVEVLDYYEGRTFFDFEIKTPHGADTQEAVKDLLKRVSKRDPLLYDLLNDGLKKFNSEVKYLANITLENVTDSKHLYFPKNCTVEQIAIQRDSQLQEPVKFVVSKDLWDQMDVANQAGLILHEILYRQYIVNNLAPLEVDSRIVRKFNAMIAADLLVQLSEKEFKKIVSVFRPEITQRSIIGVPLIRQYESGGIPMTSEQTYTLDGEVVHSLTCHFSKVGKGPDLQSKVRTPARVEADFVVHEETKIQRTYSDDRKNFCVSSLSKVKASINYLSDNEVLIGDVVWTLREKPTEIVVIKPNNSPSTSLSLIMKKWYNKIPQGAGSIELIQDLSTEGMIKVSATCHFSDGTVKAYVEAPVTLTENKIINSKPAYQKVLSPSGRFFCMAVVSKRELLYKIIDDNQISISGDEFIPDGTVLKAIN